MANDRMYLRCKGCGKTLMIAKTFATGYVIRKSVEEINDFLMEHAFCNFANSDYGRKLQDFELRYESEPSYHTDQDGNDVFD